MHCDFQTLLQKVWQMLTNIFRVQHHKIFRDFADNFRLKMVIEAIPQMS